MAKGYAEGPAAEEAERRREELAEGTTGAARPTRVAVEGCTAIDPERHFLGWRTRSTPTIVRVRAAGSVCPTLV
jgi:hypothetical protein